MKRVHRNGGNRMIELGKKAVQLWFVPEDLDILKTLAKNEYRPVTAFIMEQIRPLIRQFRVDNPSAHKPKRLR